VKILRARQLVPAPLDQVFPFFARPENLAVITPDWLNFRILTPSPIPMSAGAVVDYLIKLGPIPTRWRTLISTFDPPHCFVDQQLNGPYSFWHHTHRFEEVQDGTLLSDEVRYLMPFGPLGELVHNLVIKRQLKAIFAHRATVIARQFGAPAGAIELEFGKAQKDRD
jgi:ligand-binding SRPBCC domain-containing protein